MVFLGGEIEVQADGNSNRLWQIGIHVKSSDFLFINFNLKISICYFNLLLFCFWDRISLHKLKLSSDSDLSCLNLWGAGIAGTHHNAWILGLGYTNFPSTVLCVIYVCSLSINAPICERFAVPEIYVILNTNFIHLIHVYGMYTPTLWL